MIEFSKLVSERWNISAEIAEQVCNAYVKGDSPYYLGEYNIDFCVELSTTLLWEIFDFLKEIDALSSKKKRVINAYKKADMLSNELEMRVNYTANSFELDDLLIPVRPNPRSRGQMAVKKGLKPLADTIMKQEEEAKTLEELAQPFVGTDPSLDSTDAVIQGAKDVVAEIIAYDETVRAMAREFAFEDGYFEVIPKNKKDPKFSQYIARNIPVHELAKQELLELFTAEEKKKVRLKLGVQLFRITELLRHHFITNPDAVGFDIICETIDESWMRLIQPIVERDIKLRFQQDAQSWAGRQMVLELEKSFALERKSGPLLITDANGAKQVLFCAVGANGELLGTTTERKTQDDKPPVISERLKQFLGRYRTGRIIIKDNDGADYAEALLNNAFNSWEELPEFTRYKGANDNSVAKCKWIQDEFESLLDDAMKNLYADAICFLKPIALISKIGTESYEVHQFQNLLPVDRFNELIDRIKTAAQLQAGIPIKEIVDSPLLKLNTVTEKQLLAIRAADAEGGIATKNDMLKIKAMSEVSFRNIAGFIVVPDADSLLDRTVVHPDYFDWFPEITEQLNVSLETVLTEPEYLHSFTTDDLNQKIFIDRNLIPQIIAGRRFVTQPTNKVRRKLKLNEVQEGAIVSGRVTNITQFGVFVNINAVCDGLIHISQLADEYVETPEQVVSVNDRVDVRILKVDVKKRRISLSMRNLGQMAPKVKPSRGQLDNLAEHFKNR